MVTKAIILIRLLKNFQQSNKTQKRGIEVLKKEEIKNHAMYHKYGEHSNDVYFSSCNIIKEREDRIKVLEEV